MPGAPPTSTSPAPRTILPQRQRSHIGNRARPRTARGRAPFSISTSTNPNLPRDLPNLVRQLLVSSRAHKSPLVARWRRDYFYLRNRPNLLPAGAPSRSIPQVPEIFPIVASKVGYKSDRKFSHSVTAAPSIGSTFFNTASLLARDLETLLDASWVVNADEAQVMQSVWDSEIYGTGILKTSWDLGLANGLGDARITRVDPFTFYPDPAAHNLDDANYIIEARRMSLQEMDRRWPGSARKLAGAGWLESTDEAPQQLESLNTSPKANPGLIPSTNPTASNTFFPYKMTGGRGFDATDDPGVTVLECWLREHTNDPDPDAPFGYHQTDEWRCVVVAGNEVLLDCPARELWSHGSHPYSRIVPHDIGEFWGFSTVELLVPAQASINRLLSALVLNTELTGNPVFIESATSGLQRTQVTNKPGQRLTMSGNGQAKAEWMQPPQASPMMPELIRYFLQRLEVVSGMGPASKGSSPGGRQSQGVVDAMQEAAFVRVRMELRQMEYALRDAGTKKASLIVENYTTPRAVSILGPDGEQSINHLQARHFFLPGPDGEAPLDYTLLVSVGADQATTQKMLRDEAVMLFSLGVIDQMEVLNVFNWPGRAEVFKRIQYQQAAGTFQAPGARKQAQH